MTMPTKDTQLSGRHSDASQETVIASRALGIRVVAPAGSGKTETLVRRAVKRIEKDGIRPERLLVLTFDNSAKKSFEQKFNRIAPKAPTPTVSTLNAFGNKLLRQHFQAERGELVRAAQADELQRTLSREYPQPEVLHWDGRHRTLADAFSSLKNQGFLPAYADSSKARRWLRSHFLPIARSGRKPGTRGSLDAGRLGHADGTVRFPDL